MTAEEWREHKRAATDLALMLAVRFDDARAAEAIAGAEAILGIETDLDAKAMIETALGILKNSRVKMAHYSSIRNAHP